jgi:quercetin dioxygenase-like cupin family protein
MQSVRRIITAQPRGGPSGFARVEDVAPMLGDVAFYSVWGWDRPQTVPVAHVDERTGNRSVFPPLGGVRIQMVDFPPSEPGTVRSAGSDEMEAATSEGERLHGDSSGMHRTDSVDIAFVMRGEMTLATSDGEEMVIREGDVVVQNGTDHRWGQTGPAGCLVAYVVLGAEPAGMPA